MTMDPHDTPLERWKALAKIENARAQGKRTGPADASGRRGVSPDPGMSPAGNNPVQLRKRLVALFEAGQSPANAAAREQMTEAVAWLIFKVWFRTKYGIGKQTPDAFYRMRLRRVYELKAEGFNHQEAADHLGITLGTIEMRVTTHLDRFWDISGQ